MIISKDNQIPSLEIKNLKKYFDKTAAVDDITLNLYENQIFW